MTIGLIAMSVAIALCGIGAFRSKKAIAHDVFLVLASLLAPMVGNLLILMSGDWLLSNVGGYLYYVGIDFTVAALLRFSTHYCGMPYRGTLARRIVLVVLAIDVVQLLLNPLFGHAFIMEEALVEGTPYYVLVPFVGQMLHRMVAYGIFAVSVFVFIYRCVESPNVYLERYLIILIAMLLGGAWETYNIYSGSVMDLSFIGFGAFGLLVYLFALHYKPVLLLNGILARVVGGMSEAVFFFDRDRACIYVNTAAAELFSLKDEIAVEGCRSKIVELIGADQFNMDSEWSHRCRVVVDPDGTVRRLVDSVLNSADQTHASGEDRRFWQMTFHTVNDERGRQIGTYLSIRDRTAEELQLRRERRASEHDGLTGLYNSSHLYETGRRLIWENPDRRFCVVGIDVREFKLINDIYSKDFGDRVLCAIADKMRECATPHEVYGRITADKFGFVLPADELDAESMAQQLNQVGFAGVTYPIIIHMGVYDVVDDELPVSVMFDRAFMAITTIKHDYSRRVTTYDEAMRNNAIWNQKISAELDQAIATEQMRPYLQPMVNNDGQIQGAEVLVRWLHPEEGFLAPVRFVPFFEENGRIAQVDLYMWECACRTLARWQEMGLDDLFLSVNISPKDFYFLDVPGTINGLVEKYHVNPKNLRLEITETVVMSDAENRLRIVQDLRTSGFLVEMDDFGSGYSSLNMLKDMPVDLLKIDMMFLYKTKDQTRAQTILQTIINLSEQLGIPPITEGVETAEQLNMLTSMGCNLFQGYYFAKPMPVEEFEEKYCIPVIEARRAGKQAPVAAQTTETNTVSPIPNIKTLFPLRSRNRMLN